MVIDTGIFIEFLRAKNKSETALFSLPDNIELFVSAVTVYELNMGATSSEKKAHVDILMENMSVLPFDQRVAEIASDIFHQLKKKNQLIEFRDIFIGSTAMANDLPLKTLNTKHFSRITDLKLI